MVSKTFRGGGSCLHFVICLEVYSGFVLVIVLVLEFCCCCWFWLVFFLSNDNSQLLTRLKKNRTLNLFAT